MKDSMSYNDSVLMCYVISIDKPHALNMLGSLSKPLSIFVIHNRDEYGNLINDKQILAL